MPISEYLRERGIAALGMYDNFETCQKIEGADGFFIVLIDFLPKGMYAMGKIEKDGKIYSICSRLG
jgi:hypothetical protein